MLQQKSHLLVVTLRMGYLAGAPSLAYSSGSMAVGFSHGATFYRYRCSAATHTCRQIQTVTYAQSAAYTQSATYMRTAVQYTDMSLHSTCIPLYIDYAIPTTICLPL